MNYIKQAVLILFMAMLAISCSDDNAVDTGDGDGDGDIIPNTKVIVTTEVEGNVIDTKTIEIIDNAFEPSTATANGSYNEINKIFSIQLLDLENSLPKFQVSFTGTLNGYETGSYSFDDGGNNFIGASYVNNELDENAYFASTVDLKITNLNYIGLENRTLGTYYTSGDITMNVDYGGQNMVVKISLDNVPIAYSNMNIGG